MSDDDVGSFTAEEILGSQAQAVIATDVDGVVVYWNRAAEELYGWSAEEAVGRKVEELTVPEVSRAAAGEIMDALRDGTTWSGGFPVRRKDGTVFPVEIRIHPFRHGHERLALCLAHDTSERRHITELKRAGEEHRTHVWFLESMDRINRAMQRTNDLEQMMSEVLNAVPVEIATAHDLPVRVGDLVRRNRQGGDPIRAVHRPD